MKTIYPIFIIYAERNITWKHTTEASVYSSYMLRFSLTKIKVASGGLPNPLSASTGCTRNLNHVQIARSKYMGSGTHPVYTLALFRGNTNCPSGWKLSKHTLFLHSVVPVVKGDEGISQRESCSTLQRGFVAECLRDISRVPWKAELPLDCSLMHLAWNIFDQI